jgi:hypothetical protein
MTTTAKRPLPLALYAKRYLKMALVEHDGTQQSGILQAERKVAKIYLDGYLGGMAADTLGLLHPYECRAIPEELETIVGFRLAFIQFDCHNVQFIRKYIDEERPSPVLTDFGHYLMVEIETRLKEAYHLGIIHA